METIIVRFNKNDIRDVLADGLVVGKTETELMIAADFYVFTLSGTGYQPPKHPVNIAGTLPNNPMVITFKPGP